MNGLAFYNEINPHAAETLRNLIGAGLIAPGIVDTRSIEDIAPDELKEFTQCHFFAGIGVWSYALRAAGWPDSRPVWTGSCPCQPFSSAGQGAGFADERHLWPSFFYLIDELGPPTVLGEQVANATQWVDLVRSDMEAVGYGFGYQHIQAASAGAFHLRDRIFFMAHSDSRMRKRGRLQEEAIGREVENKPQESTVAGYPGGHEIRWIADSFGKNSHFLAALHLWLMRLPPAWMHCMPSVTRSTRK